MPPDRGRRPGNTTPSACVASRRDWCPRIGRASAAWRPRAGGFPATSPAPRSRASAGPRAPGSRSPGRWPAPAGGRWCRCCSGRCRTDGSRPHARGREPPRRPGSSRAPPPHCGRRCGVVHRCATNPRVHDPGSIPVDLLEESEPSRQRSTRIHLGSSVNSDNGAPLGEGAGSRRARVVISMFVNVLVEPASGTVKLHDPDSGSGPWTLAPRCPPGGIGGEFRRPLRIVLVRLMSLSHFVLQAPNPCSLSAKRRAHEPGSMIS